MSLAEDLAQSIARFEGYFTPGSVAERNNNPGNLRSWGNYPVVNGFVQFPDADTGWAALTAQAQKNIDRGLNLNEFFGGKPGVYGGYAPAADNNRPNTYAATVAGWLGISPTQTLATASSASSGSSDGASGDEPGGSDGGSAATAGFIDPEFLPWAVAAAGLVALLLLLRK